MARCRRYEWATAALAALAVVSCSPSDDSDIGLPHQAIALADQEDAVCGMLVREQSAPRSQVIHRDGSRFFFCSLADMLIHLSAPSPHGRPETVFVEVMNQGEDPAESHTGDHPWVRAEDAIYVIGIQRSRIMGEPVLAYAERDEAERVMQGHAGVRVLDLVGLRSWWKARETGPPSFEEAMLR